MSYRMSGIAITLAVVLMPADSAFAQGRQELLNAVIARGDKALSAGNSEQAREGDEFTLLSII